VQRALDGVYGVDVNSYAVAIARFRLLVAALQASGIKKLREAPGFRLNVVEYRRGWGSRTQADH
jgi:hypothetical protein